MARRGGRVNDRLAAIGDVAMGGTALATTQVNHQVQHDLTFAEEIAFPLLFLLALWVFRSVVAALLPLVCGALTILGGLLVLRVVDAAMPVSTYALNIVTGHRARPRDRLQPSARLAATARSSRGSGPVPTLFGGRSRPQGGPSPSAR